MKMNPIQNLNSTGQGPGAVDASLANTKGILKTGEQQEFLNLLKMGELGVLSTSEGKVGSKSPEANLLNSILNGQAKDGSDEPLSGKLNTEKNNSEDFLSLKNKINKNGEGIKNLEGIKKALTQYKNENSVLSKTIIDGQKKFEDNLDSLESGEGTDNILSIDSLKMDKKSGATSITATNKINLSNINASDSGKMINEIMNHLEENKIGTSDKMGVTVKHDELGDFKIEAQKNHTTNQIDLKIVTNNNNGKEFFAKNEVQLVKHLVDSGVKVSDFSIIGNENVSSSNNTSSKDNSSSSKSNNGFANNSEQGNGQTGSQQQERRDDAQRRLNLWEDLNTDYKIA